MSSAGEARAIVCERDSENLAKRPSQALLVSEAAFACNLLCAPGAALDAGSRLLDAQAADVRRRSRPHALNEQPCKVARAHVYAPREIFHRQISIQVLENPELEAAEDVVAALSGKVATEL